jgi:hypothetical protein
MAVGSGRIAIAGEEETVPGSTGSPATLDRSYFALYSDADTLVAHVQLPEGEQPYGIGLDDAGGGVLLASSLDGPFWSRFDPGGVELDRGPVRDPGDTFHAFSVGPSGIFALARETLANEYRVDAFAVDGSILYSVVPGGSSAGRQRRGLRHAAGHGRQPFAVLRGDRQAGR